MGESLRHAVIA